MAKRPNSQDLVQVSTHIPSRDRVKLETLAKTLGISRYKIVRMAIEDFLTKAERTGAIKEPQPKMPTVDAADLLE